MYKRKRSYAQAGMTRALSRPPRKRVYRRAGLIPTYRGFAPRMFARGEWKYSDVTIASANGWSTTALLTLLNGIAGGTLANQRVGMKVSIRSLEIRLNNTVNANDVTQINRWMVVLDRQANAAAPAALTDILTTADVFGMRNLANRKRFKIMLDKTAVVPDQAISGTGGRYWKVYMKFRRPLIVEYNANIAGNIGDISSNSLYLITIGNIAAGATCTGVYGATRIRYTDM